MLRLMITPFSFRWPLPSPPRFAIIAIFRAPRVAADTLPPLPLPPMPAFAAFHQRTPRRCRHFTLCRHYLFRQIAAILIFISLFTLLIFIISFQPLFDIYASFSISYADIAHAIATPAIAPLIIAIFAAISHFAARC
jgi:hypothetical protein